MSRVITFSTTFPVKHPKAGKPTFFVEKIMAGLADMPGDWKMIDDFVQYDWKEYYGCVEPKFHTIRASKRWKVGDKFSPRIWSGKPYASKQLSFSCDLEIKKVWAFEMQPSNFVDECKFFINGRSIEKESFIQVAKRDGLAPIDFATWFAGSEMMSSKRKPFEGQIICWNDRITY